MMCWAVVRGLGRGLLAEHFSMVWPRATRMMMPQFYRMGGGSQWPSRCRVRCVGYAWPSASAVAGAGEAGMCDWWCWQGWDVWSMLLERLRCVIVRSLGVLRTSACVVVATGGPHSVNCWQEAAGLQDSVWQGWPDPAGLLAMPADKALLQLQSSRGATNPRTMHPLNQF